VFPECLIDDEKITIRVRVWQKKVVLPYFQLFTQHHIYQCFLPSYSRCVICLSLTCLKLIGTLHVERIEDGDREFFGPFAVPQDVSPFPLADQQFCTCMQRKAGFQVRDSVGKLTEGLTKFSLKDGIFH